MSPDRGFTSGGVVGIRSFSNGTPNECESQHLTQREFFRRFAKAARRIHCVAIIERIPVNFQRCTRLLSIVSPT